MTDPENCQGWEVATLVCTVYAQDKMGDDPKIATTKMAFLMMQKSTKEHIEFPFSFPVQ